MGPSIQAQINPAPKYNNRRAILPREWMLRGR